MKTTDTHGRWADPRDYWKEINYIAKKEGKSVASIQIDDVTFGGEPVVFISGKYWGYIDFYFYLEMDMGLTLDDDEYWSRYEEYKKK